MRSAKRMAPEAALRISSRRGRYPLTTEPLLGCST